MLEITGAKKALADCKRWTNQCVFHCANIMLDRSTGEVWADCFINENAWIEYHDSDIISLLGYIRMETNEVLTEELLREYAEKACS